MKISIKQMLIESGVMDNVIDTLRIDATASGVLGQEDDQLYAQQLKQQIEAEKAQQAQQEMLQQEVPNE